MKKLKEPFVIILVGPPLSGKTTWIKENFPNTGVISRDQIILDLSGLDDYNQAFKTVNQKNVDRVLNETFIEFNDNKKNAIVDMTHMSSKRRRKNLNYFSDDYYKLAVVFPILSNKKYKERNEKRLNEEKKFIPDNVIKQMISSFVPVSKEEGFDKIIILK